jgi:hypothetical protein
MTEEEKAILVAINSAKGVGYVEGMRAGKQKPLSDEEILEILIDKGICGRLKDGSLCYWQADADLHDFARAIEERHGIK